jgi:hypothetical protein
MADTLEQELNSIRNDKAYKPFLRLLAEVVEPLVNVSHINTDAKEKATTILGVLKYLKEQSENGINIRTNIENLTGGTVNTDMEVKGIMNQANRDIIFNVFRNNSDKIELPSEVIESIKVPVVLAVMTDLQAQELLDLKPFGDQCPTVLCEDFKRLRDHLNQELVDWQKRYGPTAGDWRPFGSNSSDQTISELVTEGFEAANKIAGFSPKLSPDFINIQDLNNDRDRRKLEGIRNNGCIMVVDVISMRHPTIQRAYNRTMLDAYVKTSVISIAPTRDAQIIARQLAIVIHLKLEETEFFKRLTDKFGDVDTVKRIDEQACAGELTPWIQTRVRYMKGYISGTKKSNLALDGG